MEKEVHDSELGTILIRTHSRAKRYSIKISNGILIATMPMYGDESKMLLFINDNRKKLLNALLKHPFQTNILNENTDIKTHSFKLHIFRTNCDNFYMTLSEKVLHIACPSSTNFNDEKTQNKLKLFFEKALRFEAKRILPVRLNSLAEKYKFNYSQVHIKNSKTRWGSCSSKGNINLSLSLMLLPDHLIDYVLLHELCHTVEMNHSDRFWKLLNKITNNQALALRSELRNHKMLP